jgi:methionine-rich copper-binding protein CopC
MRNVSDKSFRQSENKHFMLNNPPPPPENRAVYAVTWKKYGTAGQATDGNMVHAHCMLDN